MISVLFSAAVVVVTIRLLIRGNLRIKRNMYTPFLHDTVLLMRLLAVTMSIIGTRSCPHSVMTGKEI